MHNCIYYEHSENKAELSGESLVTFEERVQSEKGDLLLLTRKCVNEEEIQKLKKAKPKNLNFADLHALQFKAWVDLEQF